MSKSVVKTVGRWLENDYRHALIAIVALTLVSQIIPFIGVFVWIILAFCSQSYNINHSFVVFIVTFISTFVTATSQIQPIEQQGYGIATLIQIIWIYPVVSIWTSGTVLKRFRSLALAIETISIIALLSLILVYAIDGDIQYRVIKWIVESFPEINSEPNNLRSSLWLFSLIGMAMMYQIFIDTVYLILAKQWKDYLHHKCISIRKQIESIKLSKIYVVAIIFSAIFVSLFSFHADEGADIGWLGLMNLAPIIAVTYLFGGLAVFYHYLKTLKMKKKEKVIIEVFFYISLYIIPYFLLTLSFVGLADSGFNLRKRAR